MLPFQNLYKYAVAMPALEEQVNGLMGSVTPDQITDTTPTDDVKNAVRALVLPDEYVHLLEFFHPFSPMALVNLKR